MTDEKELEIDRLNRKILDVETERMMFREAYLDCMLEIQDLNSCKKKIERRAKRDRDKEIYEFMNKLKEDERYIFYKNYKFPESIFYMSEWLLGFSDFYTELYNFLELKKKLKKGEDEE